MTSCKRRDSSISLPKNDRAGGPLKPGFDLSEECSYMRYLTCVCLCDVQEVAAARRRSK